MKFRSLLVGILAFVLVTGVVSAGVLGYFGIIQGTAQVDPAVEITNKSLSQGSNVDVGVRNNLERTIDEQVDLTRYNATDGETTIESDITFSEDNWEKVFGADLSEAKEVRVEIGGTIVNSVGVDTNE